MRRLPILCVLLIISVYANAVPYSNEVEDADELEEINSPESIEDGVLDADLNNVYKPKHSKEKKSKEHKHSKEKKSKEKKTSKESERPTISDDAIFLPHERFCQYFYVFDGAESRLLSCAKGHRFDAEKLQCLKTKEVNCVKRKKNVASSEEKKIGINFKCPKWSGLHKHEHYCHLYYNCQNKKPQLYMCPPGMLFDEHSQNCAYRSNVDCKKRVDPNANGDDETDEFLDPNEPTHQCQTMKGVSPHPYFCNKYIRCWYGYGDVYVCPKGYLFDSDLLSCQPKKNVYCDEREDPSGYDDEEEPFLIDNDPDYICPRSKGRFRHGMCAMFYQCEREVATVYSCPPEKLFDAKTETCRKASEVSCNDDVDNETDDAFICPAREGVFKDDADCGSYYKCKRDKAQHLRCPEGELFDTDWKSCADQEEVTCGDRLHPNDDPEDENDDNVVDSKPDYKCEKRFGRFTHQEVCNWYYQCKDGNPSVRVCRNGRYYDVTSNSCQNEVECGNRKPDAEQRPTLKPDVFVCPSKSGKYPHERDCSAFYKCDNRKYKIHYCSKGKLYNERKKTCESDYKVTCGSRIHPDLDPEEPEDEVVDITSPFYCDQRFGRTAHDMYCNLYYRCSDGQSSARACKKGKRYDYERGKCVEQSEVDCYGKPDYEEEPEDEVLDIVSNFYCDANSGRYVHDVYCNLYYHCSQGRSTVRVCKEGKRYDYERRKCVEQNEVFCDGRPDYEPEDKVIDPFPNFWCQVDYAKFPHQQFCNLYYQCVDARSSLRECRKGKRFDMFSNTCRNKEEVICDGKPDNNEEPATKEPETEKPDTEEPITEKPDTEEPITEEPDTEEPITEEPDTEEPETDEPDTEKPHTEDPDTEEPDPEEPDTEKPEDKVIDPNPDFVCQKNYGRYIHKDYCNWYYQCNNGKPSLLRCGKGTRYDSHKRKCLDKDVVKCNKRKDSDGKN